MCAADSAVMTRRRPKLEITGALEARVGTLPADDRKSSSTISAISAALSEDPAGTARTAERPRRSKRANDGRAPDASGNRIPLGMLAPLAVESLIAGPNEHPRCHRGLSASTAFTNTPVCCRKAPSLAALSAEQRSRLNTKDCFFAIHTGVRDIFGLARAAASSSTDDEGVRLTPFHWHDGANVRTATAAATAPTRPGAKTCRPPASTTAASAPELDNDFGYSRGHFERAGRVKLLDPMTRNLPGCQLRR